ncbi:hypothetical protein RRG08_033255 [Elysia crispata]|uniref:Uncharacterized protein n=1 Tax=Elysia crispata TaxID=231223 RepID=A0AAE1DCY6_9GAST|nr:hypothetical protein RRG08_033255 [Elysia crispata]
MVIFSLTVFEVRGLLCRALGSGVQVEDLRRMVRGENGKAQVSSRENEFRGNPFASNTRNWQLSHSVPSPSNGLQGKTAHKAVCVRVRWSSSRLCPTNPRRISSGFSVVEGYRGPGGRTPHNSRALGAWMLLGVQVSPWSSPLSNQSSPTISPILRLVLLAELTVQGSLDMRATLTTAAIIIIIIIIIYPDNLRSQSSIPQHPHPRAVIAQGVVVRVHSSQSLRSLLVSASQRHSAATACQPADAPPPGAYNVVQSFEQSSRPNMAKPRTEAARRKHNSFMSAASRFAQPADLVSKKPENENPVNATVHFSLRRVFSSDQVDRQGKHKPVQSLTRFKCKPAQMSRRSEGVFSKVSCPSEASSPTWTCRPSLPKVTPDVVYLESAPTSHRGSQNRANLCRVLTHLLRTCIEE